VINDKLEETKNMNEANNIFNNQLKIFLTHINKNNPQENLNNNFKVSNIIKENEGNNENKTEVYYKKVNICKTQLIIFMVI